MRSRLSRSHLVAVVIAWMAKTVDAGFGVTTKGNSYSVDTNGGLVFDVSK